MSDFHAFILGYKKLVVDICQDITFMIFYNEVMKGSDFNQFKSKQKYMKVINLQKSVGV